ncbi:class I SAM-dependent methyltransferase [Corynebacterium breve]|uniref:Class I SAM-dependent methyltransferase n=1 Tax=Corynebacterium breve TaxID=3049799 RepID=A0ABY8VMK6_9CORY|nr:class I SAM-dependent methyltransferase [Corynebacterium breve]WIM68795.1 class I SAM-dependent methyltransferase [Corynebacterium breve]
MTPSSNPHDQPLRAASSKEAPSFRNSAHRARSAEAFKQGADVYDDVRPSYPPEVATLVDDCKRITDIGAGTGKLTQILAQRGRELFASDLSADMTRVLHHRLPAVPVWRATAEATGLSSASMDALTCAQTWHWVDVAAASAEADRVIRPTGKLLLVWNTLDVSDAWVLRLARIIHSGDIQREGFYPEVHAPWQLRDELRTRWVQTLTTDQVYALAQTRSYWLRSDEKIRARVTENLRWYLFDHLGFTPGQELPIPYRTDAFVYQRVS